MLTSKQRAFLRGLANKTEATIQIGKGGINEKNAELVKDALEKYEIVKIHVLNNAFSETKDVCHEMAALVGAEEVQVIGNKFILYKQSVENRKIYLDKLIVKVNVPAKAKKNIKPAYKAKAAYFKEIEKEKELSSKRYGYAFKSKSYANKGTGTSNKNGTANKKSGTTRYTHGLRARSASAKNRGFKSNSR